MKKLFKKMICATVAVTFTALTVFPSPSMAQQMFSLPAPGAMIAPSPAFSPVILRGIKIHPGDPFQFDFLIDSGELKLKEEELKTESTRLIKYFLASLTVPEDDLWVNLSPFEKDRIIPNEFGTTEMGRDLLAQDYLLKQLTASLIYPETDLGKKFWDRVYKRAQELYGTTDVAISTFNKVWILPDKAVVNEVGDTAFVSESHLKVMLEEDYLAFSNQPAAVSPLKAEINKLSSQIIRDLIIPEIEKEVNTGKNFARLRQVYNSLILAAWYKRALKESILAQVYADKNKVAGVDLEDKTAKEKIYQQYLEAYKKGVYNFIKEEYDPASEEMKPRKYFSGGFRFGKAMDRAMTVEQPGAALAASRLQGVTGGKLSSVNVVFIPPRSGDRAMPDTKAFKINTYTMDSGARVLTRLAAGRGQFDPAHMLDQDEIVEKEGEAAVFSPDENGKWDEWGSSLMTIEYEYHWGLMREIIDGATADPARTFTVVDWGAGPAKALNEIARELKARGIKNVRLVGVSNRYSPEWKSLDPSITMVFDNARNLDRYLEPKSVDLMFSYYGLRHLKPDLDKYLDGLSKIFNDGGKIFFNFSLNQGKLLDQLKGFTVKFLAEEDSVLLKKVPVGAVPDRAMLNQAAFEEYLFKAFQKSRMDAKALEKYVEDLEKHRDLDKNIDGIVTAIGKDYDPDLNKYDRDVIEALGRVAEKLGKAAPSRRGDRAMTGGDVVRIRATDTGNRHVAQNLGFGQGIFPGLAYKIEIIGDKTIEEVYGDLFREIQAEATRIHSITALMLEVQIDMDNKKIFMKGVFKDPDISIPYMAREAEIFSKHFPGYILMTSTDVVGMGALLGIRRNYEDVRVIDVNTDDQDVRQKVLSGEISLQQIIDETEKLDQKFWFAFDIVGIKLTARVPGADRAMTGGAPIAAGEQAGIIAAIFARQERSGPIRFSTPADPAKKYELVLEGDFTQKPPEFIDSILEENQILYARTVEEKGKLSYPAAFLNGIMEGRSGTMAHGWGITLDYAAVWKKLQDYQRPYGSRMSLLTAMNNISAAYTNTPEAAQLGFLFQYLRRNLPETSDEAIRAFFADAPKDLRRKGVFNGLLEFLTSYTPLGHRMTASLAHAESKSMMKAGKAFAETPAGKMWAKAGYELAIPITSQIMFPQFVLKKTRQPKAESLWDNADALGSHINRAMMNAEELAVKIVNGLNSASAIQSDDGSQFRLSAKKVSISMVSVYLKDEQGVESQGPVFEFETDGPNDIVEMNIVATKALFNPQEEIKYLRGIGAEILRVFFETLPVGVRITSLLTNFLTRQELASDYDVNESNQVFRVRDGKRVVDSKRPGEDALTLDEVFFETFLGKRIGPQQGLGQFHMRKWGKKGVAALARLLKDYKDRKSRIPTINTVGDFEFEVTKVSDRAMTASQPVDIYKKYLFGKAKEIFETASPEDGLVREVLNLALGGRPEEAAARMKADPAAGQQAFRKTAAFLAAVASIKDRMRKGEGAVLPDDLSRFDISEAYLFLASLQLMRPGIDLSLFSNALYELAFGEADRRSKAEDEKMIELIGGPEKIERIAGSVRGLIRRAKSAAPEEWAGIGREFLELSREEQVDLKNDPAAAAQDKAVLERVNQRAFELGIKSILEKIVPKETAESGELTEDELALGVLVTMSAAARWNAEDTALSGRILAVMAHQRQIGNDSFLIEKIRRYGETVLGLKDFSRKTERLERIMKGEEEGDRAAAGQNRAMMSLQEEVEFILDNSSTAGTVRGKLEQVISLLNEKKDAAALKVLDQALLDPVLNRDYAFDGLTGVRKLLAQRIEEQAGIDTAKDTDKDVSEKINLARDRFNAAMGEKDLETARTIAVQLAQELAAMEAGRYAVNAALDMMIAVNRAPAGSDQAMMGGYNARVQRTDEGLIVRWEVAYDNLPDDQWPALFDSLPVMEAGEAAQKFASGREAVSLLQVRDKVKVFGLEHAEAFAAKHQIGVRIGDLSYRLQDRTIQLIDRQGKVLREFEDADIRRFLALRIHSVISSILVEGPRRDLQRLAKKLRIAKEGVPYQADFTGDTIKIHLGGIDPVIDKRSGAVVPGGVPTLADQAYLLARMALALRNSVFQKTEQGVVRLPSVYGLLTYNPVSDNAMMGEVKKAEQLLNQKRLLLHASRDNDMDQNIISQGVKATRVVPGGGWRGEPGVHLGQNNHDMEAPEGVVQGWRTNTAFYISQKTIFDSDPLQRGRVYVVSGQVRALDSWNAEDPTRREVRMDGPEGAVIIPAAYLTGVIANVRDKDREILRMIEANKFLPLYLIDKIDGKIVLKKALSAKAVQTQTASIRAKNLDKAMMAKPSDVGGIDFNPANLNLEINRDGKGMPIPFTPQELEQINLPGLVPIIINITPVTNLPLFLGASTEQPIGQLSMK